MRTKNLLLSAAAIAAGAISAQAQSNVYSVNVVGYVNSVLPAAQYALVATPLDAGTNDLNTVAAALPNKSQAQIWNGSSFTSSTKASGLWSPNLSVPPGIGYFLRSPSAVTNTYVGSVVTAFGQTNTMNLPGAVYSLVGSVNPLAGTLNDAGVNTLNLNATIPNKSQVQVWNGSSYTSSTKASGSWTPNLPIGVAQGFFLRPASATNWSQTLQ